MSTAPITTRRAKVLRNFDDAGDERRYTKDEILEIPEGQFINFQAAGLVEATNRRVSAG